MKSLLYAARICRMKGRELIYMTLVSCLIFASLYNSLRLISTDYVEQTIINSVNLIVKIDNNHLFTKVKVQNTANDIALNKERLSDFIKTIREIGKDEGVCSYNYNLCIADPIINGYVPNVLVIGVENESFFSSHNVEIIEGQSFKGDKGSEEYDEMIVSDSFAAKYLGDYTIGDTVFMHLNNKDYEMILSGIYTYDYQYDYSHGRDDYFINNDSILVTNGFAEDVVNENLNLNGVFINNIWFQTEDYNSFKSVEKTIIDYDKEDYSKYHNTSVPLLSLTVKDNNYNDIMKSISNIKRFYSIAFLAAFLSLSIIVGNIVVYVIDNNKEDIKIFYALGQSRFKIVIMYQMAMFFKMMVGLISGCVSGICINRMLFTDIINSIYSNQVKLAEYTVDKLAFVKNNSLIYLNFKEMVLLSVICFIVIFIIVFMVSGNAVKRIMKRRIVDI